MSSSGGQRFPVRGKSATARHMNIFGVRVLSTYTHVSDQWSTYGTWVMVPGWREAHFVLDEILGNATDLPMTEHGQLAESEPFRQYISGLIGEPIAAIIRGDARPAPDQAADENSGRPAAITAVSQLTR